MHAIELNAGGNIGVVGSPLATLTPTMGSAGQALEVAPVTL